MANLILVLGDQLSPELSALEHADKTRDRIVMAEVAEEASYTNHHKKKLVLLFSAMRHFADQLRDHGWQVHYQRFHPDNPHQSLEAVIADQLGSGAFDRIVTTECGEWRLHEQIQQWPERLGVPVEIRPDTRFIAGKGEFASWAKGRKQLRMEFFYREMRRKTGLLMTPDGEPEGGQWNFDADNRKKWTGKPPAPAPFRVEPDTITQEVIELVDTHFADHFGTTDDFHFAVTAEDARAALDHFLDFALPCFGDYQDAMSDSEDWLFHSILSPYINCGLLDPLTACEAAAQAWYSGRAPLNAVEGFIRQILGWREFVRGIYWLNMPGYARENRLCNTRALPWFYWTGDTKMRCMHKAIDATRRNAYAHHIQRLMVTGNFALLAGIKPEEICDWYLAVYADAYDWVELPNVLGMVMHADGGYLGSKPYAASGKYIQRMSDHCKHCHYKVQDATGERACPFNALYWHFIDRHRDDFASNPRMGMMYRNWDKQAPERRAALLRRAEQLLEQIETL
ncbi:cryptochrome/photolyase family protein [Marinobacter persicus]|jgi:deoxyribodipyrimidine photolyase-related protein|uniref:Deoxyribodipyrimidine photolyase-related protein n=1 Tax=Marinobacter persicus TaxID=930118 RepID=A0A2S6G5Q4_9GAMM|nr:cryptochrome/photolyase family protein [Marinobacter persicus]PPK50385.1 deoxyribodipyrimidine photolyase-related protein [Marinobacter persicus]PPK54467.1 deoxyribodipyrimidine photolyase-related protein [Marinobacter persicus]PPK57573.1 deoxyribodipyrimidine photolyase-related protein [Marinobacter persicus]